MSEARFKWRNFKDDKAAEGDLCIGNENRWMPLGAAIDAIDFAIAAERLLWSLANQMRWDDDICDFVPCVPPEKLEEIGKLLEAKP